MLKYITLTFIFLAILLPELDIFRLVAQESNSASVSNWLDAVKLLDSLSVDEAKRGEAWLRQELAKEETPVEAAWALTLFCIKRNDLAALERVIKAVGPRYPNPPMPVVIAMERMKLSLALFQDDAVAAEASMKKLINAAKNATVAKEDRQLNATSIGAIVGMLESEAAQSPIALETLNQIKETMAAIKKDDISVQFDLAYESSKSKASLLTDKLATLEATGMDPIQAELQRLTNEQEKQSNAVEDAEEAMRLAKLNADEQTKANRVSLKRIQAAVAKLEQNWKVPTAGHPGPEKPAPEKPFKSSIPVDEYEYKNETVTETDSTGKQVQRTRSTQVRRSQTEIDREREFKYARLIESYRFTKAEYDEFIFKYRNVLATWIQADRDRREKIQEDKRNSLQQASELSKQIDELDAERIAAVKELAGMRVHLRQLENGSEMLAEVVRTAATQKPESSFRPGFFETVFVEKEKSRLLKAFKKSTQ